MTKMIFNVKTDLVSVEDPQINKNAMQLSMSRNGVKNFWFNINKGNTKEDNLDWIPSEEDPNLRLDLSLSSQGDNVNPTENNLYLGILKISFIIHLMQADLSTVSSRLKKRGFAVVKIQDLVSSLNKSKQDCPLSVPSVGLDPGGKDKLQTSNSFVDVLEDDLEDSKTASKNEGKKGTSNSDSDGQT
jgi:hypothetical protein